MGQHGYVQNQLVNLYVTKTKNITIGEYIKDVDKIIIPEDPLLKDKFPTPIMERGHCDGIWESMEESRREDNDGVLIRDCYGPEYIQPLANMNSKVSLTYIYCNNIQLISHN